MTGIFIDECNWPNRPDEPSTDLREIEMRVLACDPSNDPYAGLNRHQRRKAMAVEGRAQRREERRKNRGKRS